MTQVKSANVSRKNTKALQSVADTLKVNIHEFDAKGKLTPVAIGIPEDKKALARKANNRTKAVETIEVAPIGTRKDAKVIGKRLPKTGILVAKDAPKAPKAQAPKVEYSTLEQTKALADMVRGLYARIESVETENAVLRGQCDVLGKVIVGIQLSFAQATVPTPKVDNVGPTHEMSTKATTPKAIDAGPVIAVMPKGSNDVVYADLIADCVDSVIDGINNGTYSEKVIPQCDNDLRAYMTLSQRKAVKAFRTANDGYTLKGISEDIVRAFEDATECKAATYAK